MSLRKKNKISPATAVMCAAMLFMFSSGADARKVAPPPADSYQTILLPMEFYGHGGLRYAAGKLADAMKELYGTRPKIISNKGFLFLDPGQDGYIVVGCDGKELEEPALGVMQKEAALGEEGFKITTQNKYRPAVVVRGGGVRGCVYGIARLIEKLRLNPEDLTKINIEESPAFPIRISSGTPQEDALMSGYNARASSIEINKTALLEGAEPKMFSHHGSIRREVLANRIRFRLETWLDRALGLETVTVSDEFVFNRALLNRPVSEKLLDPKTGRICACEPEVWRFINEKYAELSRDFLSGGYTAIGMGENIPGDEYFGNAPAPEMPWEGCEKCPNASYVDRTASFISRVRDAISPAGSKRKYIQRAWGNANSAFHSKPGVYEAILRNVPDKDNLYISIKYTKTDFWRNNFPNENIGAGGTPQIVEFQSAREFEGDGAFPNYMGEEYAAAYKYAKERGAAGVWVWNGKHATGPNIKTGIWNEANEYAAARLAWDPGASPEELARDWAQLKFGKPGARDIARILLMSDDAALKLFYFKAYAEKKGEGRPPNENWLRGGAIAGEAPLRAIYEAARGDIQDMVTEKQRGVDIASQMLVLSSGLRLPDEQRRQVMDTIRYELMLGKVLADYSSAYFFYSRWKEKGNLLDKQTAKLYATMWNIDWKDYLATVKTLGWAASPYRDGGMAAVMVKISGEVDVAQDRKLDGLKARVAAEIEKAGLRK